MATLKAHGWSISVNEVSGRLNIYRVGSPGEIELPIVDGAYAVRVVNEVGSIVDSLTVRHDQLE